MLENGNYATKVVKFWQTVCAKALPYVACYSKGQVHIDAPGCVGQGLAEKAGWVPEAIL